ncbi:MAG: hypothetical protein RL685_6694 [Pseudomonadota bacterium]
MFFTWEFAPGRVIPPGGSPRGECLERATLSCSSQLNALIGSNVPADFTAQADALLSCVHGGSWSEGGAIPKSSCYFSDPPLPRGTLLRCYCGSTPDAVCPATGPSDPLTQCSPELVQAARCSTVTPACVTSSGSNPAAPLGQVLQLLNCEKTACEEECGFPSSVIVDDE